MDRLKTYRCGGCGRTYKVSHICAACNPEEHRRIGGTVQPKYRRTSGSNALPSVGTYRPHGRKLTDDSLAVLASLATKEAVVPFAAVVNALADARAARSKRSAIYERTNVRRAAVRLAARGFATITSVGSGRARQHIVITEAGRAHLGKAMRNE